MNAYTLLRSFNAAVGAFAPAIPARIARELLLRPRRRALRTGRVPDGAERITFRFGLSGLRWGRSGPVVLMLHGWEGGPGQFGALVAPLRAAGRQVIALDAPAHGHSEGEEATLMEFAFALQEAAAEIRNLEAVVGHSLGAAAAAIALSRGLPAQRAVLVAAPASIEEYLYRFAAQLGLPRSAARRFVRLVEDANGLSARQVDIARLAARLEQAALVVHDRDDGAVPFRDAERIAANWPGARLLATSGLGHARLLADTGVARAIAGFLLPPAAASASPLRRAAAG